MRPEEFARHHGDDLLALGIALSGRRADGEDLLHDTYVKLLRSWEQVDSARSPIAYARRVLVNTFLTSRRRARLVVLSRDGVSPEGAREDTYDLGGDPVLASGLARLPERQRTVLALRYLADLDDAEIARTMTISRVAVRSHASRGLAALRTYLTEVPHV